jgi:hypothetical protein
MCDVSEFSCHGYLEVFVWLILIVFVISGHECPEISFVISGHECPEIPGWDAREFHLIVISGHECPEIPGWCYPGIP